MAPRFNDNDSSDEHSNRNDTSSDNGEDSWRDSGMGSSTSSLDNSTMPPGMMRQGLDHNARPKDEDVISDPILSSLGIADHATAMHNIPPACPRTCSWVFKHPTFIAFAKATNGLLWIEAPSGYGKSVMAKLFVNEYTTSPLHYFFCDSNTKGGNNRLAVLRSIVQQLMVREPELISHANASYEKLGRNFSENLDDLINIFKDCVQDSKLGDTVILIDGLDECSDFQDLGFLDWITSTLQNTPNALRFIVTSRPSPAALRDSSNTVFRLLLDAEEVQHEIRCDVQHFIETTVNELPTAHKWTSQDQTEFVTELTERSKNTFLWASLFLKELWGSKELSPASARTLLEGTPHGVDGMYRRIFDKVTGGDRESTKFLLQMIIAAGHSLKVQDLNWLHSAFTSGGHAERADTNSRLDSEFQTYLRDLCGSVVTVTDGKASLQHKSVKDFVTEKSGSAWYHFTEQEAKVQIFQCCIWRLRFVKHLVQQMAPNQKSQFENGDLTCSPRGQPDRFLGYALHHWVNHFNEIQQHADQSLIEQVRFLYEDQETFQLLRKYVWVSYRKVSNIRFKEALVKALESEDVSQIGSIIVEVSQPLFDSSVSMVRMASCVGHIRVFRAILDANPRLFHTTFDDGWTALCTATANNQLEMVEAILNQKVDLQTPCKGLLPLYYAAANSNPRISWALLRHGAAVDAFSSNQMTALHRAAQMGKMEIVRALLDAKASPNLVDAIGRTALHRAAGEGHIDIVNILLEKLADPEIHDKEARTPLVFAAEKGKKTVVETLLNITPTDKFRECHGLVLHAAMKSSKLELIQMLMDAKIPEMCIGTKDKNGLSAFAYGTSTCDIGILKWFLEHGADLDERDLKGTTLLQRVSMQDKVDGAKFLIENGADLHKTDNDGRTALHYAATGSGHEAMFRLLLSSGGDLEAKDLSGRTPFHAAVVHWRSQNTLRVLKSFGANVESKNHDGETPLQTAVRTQNAGLVKCLLIDAEANRDVVSKEGFTLHQLHRASFCRNMDAITTEIYNPEKPYRFWCIDQLPSQDDNSLQGFKGTLSEAFILKNQLIKHFLNPNGASESGKALPLHISFQKDVEPATTPGVAPLEHASNALLEYHQNPHKEQISSVQPQPAPEATPPNNSSKDFGGAHLSSHERTSPMEQKQFGPTDLISTADVPRSNHDEDEIMAEQADTRLSGQGAETEAEKNAGGNHSTKIVPLFKPATHVKQLTTGSSPERTVMGSSSNTKEDMDPNHVSKLTEMRDMLDDKAVVQGISDTICDATPQSSLSDSPSSKDQEGHSPIEILSVSARGTSDEGRDAPSNSSQRRSPDPVELLPVSSHMSICSTSSAPHQENSDPPHQIPNGSDESVFSDEYDSGSESSDFMESSEEGNENFVHSLDELGRGGAPELALAMEAVRRAMVEVLQVLAVPAGVSAHNVVSCAQDSSPSQYSGPDQGYSQQTSSTDKVPAGNGVNGKRKKGGIGDDEGDYEDGDGDDWSTAGRESTGSNHCRGCRCFRGSAPGKAPSNRMSTGVQGTASLKFACPYFKHSPERHTVHRACRGPGSPEFHRILEHIDRRHKIYLCERCKEAFMDETLLTKHSGDTLYCKPREREDYSQGCSLLQRDAIRSMPKKRNLNDADAERWRNTYRILFPKVSNFEIPSPYHEVPYVDLAVVREITQGFRQYFKEQFAKRFVSEWRYPYSSDFDEIVQRQTDAIVVEYQEISHAASLELPQGPESPSSSRKRRRESASSTPGFENTTPARQKPHSEHQPQATSSRSASNLYSQHVAPPVPSYHDMTASGMPGPSQSQPDSFIPNASFTSHAATDPGYATNAGGSYDQFWSSQSKPDGFIPNAPVTSRAPIDLEYAANKEGFYDRVPPPYSAAPEGIAPYQGDGLDFFDFEKLDVFQDTSLFESLPVGEEGSEQVAAASTAMATGAPIPLRTTPAPIVPDIRAPGIGFQSGGRLQGQEWARAREEIRYKI